MRPIYIYKLIFKELPNEVYIGQTVSVDKRFSEHINAKDKTIKSKWVQSRLKKGMTPVMYIVDVALDNDTANSLETSWIKHYKDNSDFKSRNQLMQGGTVRGLKHSPEQNVAKSLRQTGRKDSIETREKKSKAMRGVPKPNARRTYMFKNEYGEIVEVKNLMQFCADNNLDPSCMSKVYRGILPHHKKWIRGDS